MAFLQSVHFFPKAPLYDGYRFGTNSNKFSKDLSLPSQLLTMKLETGLFSFRVGICIRRRDLDQGICFPKAEELSLGLSATPTAIGLKGFIQQLLGEISPVSCDFFRGHFLSLIFFPHFEELLFPFHPSSSGRELIGLQSRNRWRRLSMQTVP